MARTKIPWAEYTWNPITGCSPVSPGCYRCYARRMTYRLQSMGLAKYREGFDRVVCHESELYAPLLWKKPRMIFVCSMADLLHIDVPSDFIHEAIHVMQQANWHTFLVLTKRSARLFEFDHMWPSNVWLGVTVEDANHLPRIEDLRYRTATMKFVSFEPLLDDPGYALDLSGIGWALVGGESGNGARQIKPEWVERISVKCQEQGVPYFFKQGGDYARKFELKLSDFLRRREWPEVYGKSRTGLCSV